MYSKSCNYYKINPITMQEIKTYYDLLNSKKNLPPYISKSTHGVCCVYYLSKENQGYISKMEQEIKYKLNGALKEINDTNLLYLYNIIDYSEKYFSNDQKLFLSLFNYLEKFDSLEKTIENYLLYKYYREILLLSLGYIDDAYKEYFELVSGLADEVKQKTSYVEFIRLKNDLFNLRLVRNVGLDEQYLLLKELYERVQKNNKPLAIKLGFGLYENLYKQNKLKECISLLKNIDSLIKREALSGNIKNGLDYIFSIYSRLGFVGILINDKNIVNDSIRTIEENLRMIDKDNKLSYLYNGYSFLNVILKINNSVYVDKGVDIAKRFKSELLPNNPEQLRPENFIVNKGNYNECLISVNGLLNSMNIADNSILINSRRLLDSCVNNINTNTELKENMTITFIIGTQATICQLSEEYCSDNNIRQSEKRNNIIKYSTAVLKYVKNKYKDEPYFKTDYIKTALIRIYSSYTHLFIYQKDLETVKKTMFTFDELSEKLGINETTPFYELVLKIKGDYCMLTKDYKKSIGHYEKALRLMGESNPRKPVIYFNLGTLHYFNNNINGAIDNLNKCVNGFKNIEKEKRTFDSSRKRFTRKLDIAKNILSQLTGQ